MEQEREVSDEELLGRLRRQPSLRARLVGLLDLAEDSAGDLRLADNAELRLTQQVRQLGQEMMQAWAHNQSQAREQELRRSGRAHREGKTSSAGTPPSVRSR